MKRKIQEALIDMGCMPNREGFRSIVSIIEMTKEDDLNILYKKMTLVAEKQGKRREAVERSIEMAIKNMDHESSAWNKYIGIKKEKVTVKEFLSLFWTRLQYEE